MKRYLLIILLFTIVLALHSLPYYKRCKKCMSDYNRSHGCISPAPAWRDFSVPTKEIDGKKYATYRCCYGHSFLVEL